MPHPARPSIHARPTKGNKGNGIPDFSRKPKPTLKGKPQAKSAKSGRRDK